MGTACPEAYDGRAALDAARHAAELVPRTWEYQRNFGSVLYREGQYEQAREAFVRAMELEPFGSPYDLFGMAMVQARLGLRDEARDTYRRAVRRVEQSAPRSPLYARLRSEAEQVLGPD